MTQHTIKDYNVDHLTLNFLVLIVMIPKVDENVTRQPLKSSMLDLTVPVPLIRLYHNTLISFNAKT